MITSESAETEVKKEFVAYKLRGRSFEIDRVMSRNLEKITILNS